MSAKKNEPRLSHPTLRILRVFLERPKHVLAGADIGKATGLFSGTVYPVLARLEQAGWLTSEWETLDPSEAGRPRRRLYHLTGVGSRKATAALRELALKNEKLAWES
jgi:PadR family transcriptional regulator, regulatory protein PadR